jgi:hypothetical protein
MSHELQSEKQRADIDELRECVALASHMIRRIGTTDANSSDNIRRADKWLAIAGKLLHKTYE